MDVHGFESEDKGTRDFGEYPADTTMEQVRRSGQAFIGMLNGTGSAFKAMTSYTLIPAPAGG